jgi:hypothetical protein
MNPSEVVIPRPSVIIPVASVIRNWRHQLLEVKRGHTDDLLIRARLKYRDTGAGVVAGEAAVEALQQTGVADLLVGGGGGLDADASGGLLEDGGEEETLVEVGLGGTRLDRGLENRVLGITVGRNGQAVASNLVESNVASPAKDRISILNLRPGILEFGLINLQGLEIRPLSDIGPALGDGAISLVVLVLGRRRSRGAGGGRGTAGAGGGRAAGRACRRGDGRGDSDGAGRGG